MKTKIIITTLLLFFIFSCSKDEKENEIDNGNTDTGQTDGQADTIFDKLGIAFTDNQRFPVSLVNIEEDNELIIINDSLTGDFEGIIYRQNNHEMVVFIDETTGLPSKAFNNDHIFLFSNFNGNKVDIGLITLDGETHIFRDVESEFYTDTTLFKSAIQQTKSLKSTKEINYSKEQFREHLKMGGLVLGATGCAASALVGSVLWVELAVTVVTCGSFYANAVEYYKQQIYPDEEDNRYLTNWNNYYSAYGCIPIGHPATTIISCLSLATNIAYDKVSAAIELENEKESEMSAANWAMNYTNYSGEMNYYEITFFDSGSAKDDVFVLYKEMIPYGETVPGGSETISFALPDGGNTYIKIYCKLAPDDAGTFTITLHDGLKFSDGTTSVEGVMTEGETWTYSIYQ